MTRHRPVAAAAPSDAADTDALHPTGRGSAARREITIGYALQVMSALLLVSQHFLLPYAVGIDAYGRLAFMTGAASLLSVCYDHGFNLLVVRKPGLALHYLAAKLGLLLTIGMCAAAWTLAAGDADLRLMLSVAIHAVCFVLYTFYVHVDLAIGRMRRVFWYSLANGLLLLGLPLLFHALGLDIAFAPAAGALASLVIVLLLRGAAVRGCPPAAVLRQRLLPRRIARMFVKQFQISLGTVLDGGIVWVGVLVVTALDGFEAAGVYRMAMSAIALMTQVLPMPKQVLLRVARQTGRVEWATRYALALIAAGALQVAAVATVGQWAIQQVYPANAEAIFRAVLWLSAVPVMRALFELQTVVHDSDNALGRLVRNVSIAAICGAVAFGFGVYPAVVTFYGALTLLGLGRLLKP